MTDVSAFRDYQTRSTVLLERERALEARRAAILELRQSVQQLQGEDSAREEQLRSMRARYSQKKAAQDEKIGMKEYQVRTQQERLQQLTQEEEQLLEKLQASEMAVRTAETEIDHRKELECRLRDVRERLGQLSSRLETSDGSVRRLEARVARQEMQTNKRHTAVAERLPQYWLPRVVTAEPGAGLEETAGESVLLVDEASF